MTRRMVLNKGLATASAPVLPVGAYKQGPVGLEKLCVVACLSSSLQASKAHHRRLETCAPASCTSFTNAVAPFIWRRCGG